MSSSAAYPPAPWLLRGWGAQALLLLPGGRIASVYFGSYESGTLRYHEFIVVNRIRWLKGVPRVAIAGIWVDNEVSVAGGRAIWHLPKELAVFDIAASQGRVRVDVRNESCALCGMDVEFGRWSLPFAFCAPALGESGGEIFPFTAVVKGRAGPARIRVNGARTLAAWFYPRLSLNVPRPSRIARV